MKTFKKTSRRGCRERGANRKELQIVVVGKAAEARFDALLADRHYIGKARPTGDFLRQVAEVDGEWVGLLAWGAACYSIRDRDEWIGWNNTLRAQRQKLIVQNRRFLLLSEKGEHPNLASQVLGAAVRHLPQQWEDRFGYRPLLAETFTDIEAYEGTCYKAAGWEPVGRSKGFGRHRADFYVRHDRPKKLWLKKLQPDACELLCAAQLPEIQQGGGACNAHGVMPLDSVKSRSRMEALQEVPDPRAKNSQFRMGALLSIVAMALLSGCRDLSAIQRFGQRLTQRQRALLGLPRKRGGRFYKIPCYSVYYRLLATLDTDAFAQVLSRWLSEHSGSLPASLALDGKMVRDTIGVVSLVEHETGAPVAMALMSQKEGEGQRCEMKVGESLVGQTQRLDGKLVSADALHAQKEMGRQVVENGGDYLLQIKGNQPTLQAHAQRVGEQATPFLNKPNAGTDALSAERSR
jgi:hypothetical protein